MADTFSFALAGSGGAGVMTAGTLLLEGAARAGHYGLMSKLAGSQVRGGEAAVRAADPKLKALAREFAAEEKLHVEHVAALLERTPKPAADWAADYDPPVSLA